MRVLEVCHAHKRQFQQHNAGTPRHWMRRSLVMILSFTDWEFMGLCCQEVCGCNVGFVWVDLSCD